MTPNNVQGPNGPIGPQYVQTANTINNNNTYYMPVPDSHYQDRVAFSGAGAGNPTVTHIIQHSVHQGACDLQAFLGGPDYYGLTQSQQLDATFAHCDRIINSLYAQPQSQVTTIIQYQDPLADLRAMESMVQQAIYDAMQPVQQQPVQQQPVEQAPQQPQLNTEKVKMAASALHQAMDGWFNADADAMREVLQNLTPEERAAVELAYAEMYGHGDPEALRDDIRSNFSSSEDELLGYLNSSAHFNPLTAAAALHEAMDGLGTDEKAVRQIFANASPEQLAEIESVYNQLYGNLQEDLEGDFGFWDGAGPGLVAAGAAACVIPGVGWIAGGLMMAGGLLLGGAVDPSKSERNTYMQKLQQARAQAGTSAEPTE